MEQTLSIISRTEILKKLDTWLAKESEQLNEIDLNFEILKDNSEIGLKSLFDEVSSIKVELKQFNRLEKKRIDALQDWLKLSANQQQKYNGMIQSQTELLSEITKSNENSRIKNAFLSLIELRDFVEKIFISQSKQQVRSAGLSSFLSWGKENKPNKDDSENLQFILKKIDRILEKEDIVCIRTKGEIFDPNKMIAADAVRDNEVENNLIIDELERGYIQNNYILRYAKVIVNISDNTKIAE